MNKLLTRFLALSTLFAVAFALPTIRADEKSDLAKYDANKDGKLDDAEKATMKAEKAKQAAADLEKYDANKDGKLDDAEKATMKAEKAKAKAERDAKKKTHEGEAK